MLKRSKNSSDQSGADYLKNILDNIADPVFVKDIQHRWIDGNRAFWKFMGGPPEKFLGKSDYDFFPKSEADIFWKKDDKVFQTGETDVNEEFLTDHEGIRHIITTKKNLFLNEKGESVLVGIIRDNTAEKELEALKAHLDKIAQDEKEHQYRNIFNSTNDAILIFNMKGFLVEANAAASKIYGYSHQELVGMHGDNLSEDLARFPQFIKQAQLGKQYFIESIHVRRDKTRIAVEINGTACPYAGEPHLLAVVRDITERKQAQDALQLADRRKDEFLAMLAHELRNPLAPISNATYLLKAAYLEDHVRHEAASLIERQIDQMTTLLNDLLDVSRITLGKIGLHTEVVSLSGIIHMAIENTRSLVEEAGHTLKVDLPQHPIWLNGDAIRMAQVFTNLINNAAKYTNRGGLIEIHGSEDSQGITITVKDNGIGIPQEKLPYIFELFVQADNSLERAQGGLGIGLTLVKSIVEMHKGNIAVCSKGKGTEFTIRLPLQIIARKEKEKPIAPSAMPTPSHRILVIDDNIASAKTLAWSLEMLGNDVRVAYDGQEAIDIAKLFMPQVILLDIGLPVMNGYEICKVLRKDPSLQNSLIIAQTGWGQKEHMERSKKAGFDKHLIKPISIETLQSLLAELQAQGLTK
jgi:PAS domain S-box-containing protein